MTQPLIRGLALSLLAASLAACASEAKPNPWNLYASGQSGGYQDNDASYVAPQTMATGCTAGSGLETFGC